MLTAMTHTGAEMPNRGLYYLSIGCTTTGLLMIWHFLTRDDLSEALLLASIAGWFFAVWTIVLNLGALRNYRRAADYTGERGRCETE